MRKFTLILVVILALSVSVALVAAAANTLATYAIPWWTVDGGGGTSQGGNYTLSGTAGQPGFAIRPTAPRAGSVCRRRVKRAQLSLRGQCQFRVGS